MRCACPRKLKAKWRCAHVLAAIRLSGGASASYDDSGGAPRVLPCDAECGAAGAKSFAGDAAAKAGGGDPKRASPLPPGAPLPSRAASVRATGPAAALPVVSPPPAGPPLPKQRLSKAEREAQAEAEAERRRAGETAVRRRRLAVRVGAWLVIVAVGLLLGLWGEAAITTLDTRARAWWSPT